MSEPFIGEIQLFAFNFAPRGWATCDGQILSIAQNTALFSLLGTTFGGDGRTTFALPNLRGRVPVHTGPLIDLGQAAGSESVTLTVNEIPAHTHSLNAVAAPGSQTAAVNNFPAQLPAGRTIFSSNGGAAMNPAAIASAGGNQAHENRQPFLVVNFCIALQGIFPTRN